jgi:hypothetical protein
MVFSFFWNEGEIESRTFGIMLFDPNDVFTTTDFSHSCTHGEQFRVIMVILIDLPIIIKGGMMFSFG